jgi:hypothetical protein
VGKGQDHPAVARLSVLWAGVLLGAIKD